jgi:pimeloyl-ACP methyl ester carboxylesterase
MTNAIEVLRTPEERFAVLPNFPYSPRYIEDLPGFEGMRLHYVDEGPPEADNLFLCLHGEPTWAYLYRKMIPVFTGAGCRVVAPDFFGFGRSDKPVRDEVYTFDFHRNTVMRLMDRLDLQRITLVCQDWGGIVGLSIPAEMPERFARLLVMNTAIPVGKPVSPGFVMWKTFAGTFRDIPVAGLLALSSPGSHMSPLDLAAYHAPFPDERYQAGVRRFPQMVPVEPGMAGIEHGERAREFFANQWEGETFMAVGMQDVVLGPPVMEELRSTIRGCPPPFEIPEANHFVQEWGDQVARAALEAFGLAVTS